MARKPPLIHSLFLPVAHDFRPACWQPPVDLYRMSNGWLVKFELAGVRPEEISLTTVGTALILRGVRRDISIEEGQRSYSMEISYNEFERTVGFPCDLHAMEISTDYRDGMLLVRLSLRGGPDDRD